MAATQQEELAANADVGNQPRIVEASGWLAAYFTAL